MVMLSQAEIDALLPAWATAYLAAGGVQTKAREALLKEGQPWTTLLHGNTRSIWTAKAHRLTERCRNAGILPKIATRAERKRILLESSSLKTLASAKATDHIGSVILPGILKRIATAEQVLEGLTEIALGTAREYEDGEPPTAAQRLKLRLDALSKLADIQGLDRRPIEPNQRAERFHRLREKMMQLPLEQRRAVLAALGDTQQPQEVTPQ